MHQATKAGTPKKLKIAGVDTYFGGKGAAGTYQKIINQVRPCVRFVELFLGGGSVTRWMHPAAHHVGIDLNPEVIALWQAAGLEWLELHNMAARSYLKYLAKLRDLRGTVIYVDPPYLGATRKSRTNYRCDMRTDADHLLLLTDLVALSRRPDAPDIIVSCYPNALYQKALAGWHYEEFETQTRGGMATEGLFRNFPVVDALHDPRFHGDNYRHRQRMRKMQNRWVDKFNALPILERQALFARLAADSSNYAAAAPDSALVDSPKKKPAPGRVPAPQLAMFASSSAVYGAVVDA